MRTKTHSTIGEVLAVIGTLSMIASVLIGATLAGTATRAHPESDGAVVMALLAFVGPTLVFGVVVLTCAGVVLALHRIAGAAESAAEDLAWRTTAERERFRVNASSPGEAQLELPRAP